jgi:hypothetical protein
VKITKVKAKKGVQTSAKRPYPYNRGKGSRPPFHSLTSALGPEKMAIVDSRLLNGETGEAIAKTIKNDWKLLARMTLAALTKRLTEYRRTRLLTKLQLLADPKAPRLSDFADKVDVLQNLTKLVELQQGRVSKGIHTENALSDVLMDRKLRHEIALLGDLYAKLAELQMDLGILRKVPQKMQIEGMASRTQQLLETAMQRSHNVEMALSKAFEVLDGKFRVVSDDAKRQH